MKAALERARSRIVPLRNQRDREGIKKVLADLEARIKTIVPDSHKHLIDRVRKASLGPSHSGATGSVYYVCPINSP